MYLRAIPQRGVDGVSHGQKRDPNPAQGSEAVQGQGRGCVPSHKDSCEGLQKKFRRRRQKEEEEESERKE